MNMSITKPNRIKYVYDGDNDEDDKYFENCEIIEREIFEKYDKYLYVKLYVDSQDSELIKIYDKMIEEHNRNMFTNMGFPLVSPINMTTESSEYNYQLWLDVKCVCELILESRNQVSDVYMEDNEYYKLQPIYGIQSLKGVYRRPCKFDTGYIGNLRINMERIIYLDSEEETVLLDKYQPVCRLMNNDMDPVYVERVGTLEELYITKVRM